jgi:hypothetical protein
MQKQHWSIGQKCYLDTLHLNQKNSKIQANIYFYKIIGQKILSQTDKSAAKSR